MACIKFNNINDALETLPYARCYQSPFDKEYEFNIEVKEKNGGNYSALKELISLAEKAGFRKVNYYELNGIDGVFSYVAEFIEPNKREVQCYYSQDGLSVRGEDGFFHSP